MDDEHFPEPTFTRFYDVLRVKCVNRENLLIMNTVKPR